VKDFLLTEGSRPWGAFLLFSLTLGCSAGALSGCGAQRGDSIHPSLEPTFDSPESLSRAVLAALEAGDYRTLRSYALSKDEFRLYVWLELPASRPGRNLPLSYVWGDLDQKSTNCLRRLVAGRGGRRHELVRVEFDGETTPYQSFKVHRDARLVVRDEEGQVESVNFFGSIIEWNGRYKLFSYNIS